MKKLDKEIIKLKIIIYYLLEFYVSSQSNISYVLDDLWNDFTDIIKDGMDRFLRENNMSKFTGHTETDFHNIQAGRYIIENSGFGVRNRSFFNNMFSRYHGVGGYAIGCHDPYSQFTKEEKWNYMIDCSIKVLGEECRESFIDCFSGLYEKVAKE